MRYSTDSSWRRFGRTVVAGSPLKIFRVSAAGSRVVDALEAGGDVGPSRLVDRLVDAGAIHPDVPKTDRDGDGTSRFGCADVTVVTPQFGGEVEHDGRIVVDDGSVPPLPGASIRLPVNRGPSAARNAVRDDITTPLVAFVDDDVDTLDELGAGGWLGPLLAHFDDDRVGLVAPRVAGEPRSPLDLGPDPARIRSGTRVSYVPAAAVVARVEALDDVGWFDEELRRGEDVDLVWRLDEAGWRCRYEPASVVWHEPRTSLRARLRQHAGYGTSAAPLSRRHPGALAPVRCNAWTAAAWTAVVIGQPAIGASIAVASSAALGRVLDAIPRDESFRLAMRGHLLAGRQLAEAIRRAWWPIVAVAALGSRRARVLAAAALVAAPRRAATDVAYGWGLWRGMARELTIAPIVPAISSWPARGDRRSASTRRAPSEDGR